MGFAEMTNKNNLISFCVLDFTLFPFDVQTCFIEIFAFDASVAIQYADLQAPPSGRYTDPNIIWEVIGSRWIIQDESSYSKVIFQFTMQRRYPYHLQLIIVPTILLTILQLAVFLLPFDSGERAGFSITVVLAMQVSATTIYDQLPVTSQPIYLAYYVTGCQFAGAGISIYSMLTYRMASVISSSTKGKQSLNKIDFSIGILTSLFFFFVNLIFFLVIGTTR